MFTIQEESIGRAHDAVIRYIIDNSTLIKTEDGEVTIDPGQPISIRVENPFANPMISSASMFGPGFANEYQTTFYTVKQRKHDGNDPVYTYGNRLCDYFTPYIRYSVPGRRPWVRKVADYAFSLLRYVHLDVRVYHEWKGDGNMGGVNQIHQSIIDRLIANPESRRALAITWSPNHDIQSAEPPCLQLVMARIRPGTHIIDLYAIFRSNDMLSAWGQNAYGLAYLLKYIVNEINRFIGDGPYTIGALETVSLAPHIYSTRDVMELSKFRDKFKIMDKYLNFQKT